MTFSDIADNVDADDVADNDDEMTGKRGASDDEGPDAKKPRSR